MLSGNLNLASDEINEDHYLTNQKYIPTEKVHSGQTHQIQGILFDKDRSLRLKLLAEIKLDFLIKSDVGYNKNSLLGADNPVPALQVGYISFSAVHLIALTIRFFRRNAMRARKGKSCYQPNR